MRLQEQVTKPPKITEKRRGVRLNSRVPVTIEWDDAESGVLSVQAFTRIVGPYGCMVVLQRNLGMEQRLRVVNRATDQNNSGVVVWKGSEQVDGWEIGIELTQPPQDFWGLDL